MRIYTYFYKRSGHYSAPITVDLDPERYAQVLTRTLILDGAKVAESHLDEAEVYLIGDYDDLTGKASILPEKVFVLDCSAVVSRSA